MSKSVKSFYRYYDEDQRGIIYLDVKEGKIVNADEKKLFIDKLGSTSCNKKGKILFHLNLDLWRNLFSAVVSYLALFCK